MKGQNCDEFCFSVFCLTLNQRLDCYSIGSNICIARLQSLIRHHLSNLYLSFLKTNACLKPILTLVKQNH